MEVREAGMVGKGDCGRRECRWARFKGAADEEEAVGVAVLELSHGAGDLNSSGEAGFR